MLVIADVAAGPAILLFGLVAGVVIVFVIALVEAAVLRGLRWAGFGRSLIDSLAMNFTSAVVGLLLNAFSADLYQSCGYSPERGGRFCDWLISPWALLALTWLLSVLVEGAVLLLLRRRSARETWTAALAATPRLLPKHPTTASGLALGLAVAIGGLPAAGGLSLSSTLPLVLFAVLLAAALALW